MTLSKNLKNALCISLISALALAAVPKRSEAIVGLATGLAPLAIGGAVVAGGAGAVFLAADYQGNHGDIGDGILGAIVAVSMIPLGILGIILLDGESGQTIQYRELKTSDASALGVSVDAIQSYNTNLNKINDALKSVEFDLSQFQTKPTLADAKAAWDNYDAAIPSDAMTVVGKVSAQGFKK